jgi:hypothetical protein
MGMGGSSVPEFLYQLTKMLTDRSNRDIIEWSTGHAHGGPNNNNFNGGHGVKGGGGRIEVHNPARLESEVLSRYFRHSKYSSFQRQLNYFGFRKVAGKGKMSPCSYVNDLIATSDVRSILMMTRKKGAKEKAMLANDGGGGGSLDDDDDDEGGGSGSGGAYVDKKNRNHGGGRKRRLEEMGGHDVPSATIRHDSSRAFDDLAANVARNVAEGATTAMTTTVGTTNDRISNHESITNFDQPSSSSNNNTSKSTKLDSSSLVSTIMTTSSAVSRGVGERRYNVAVGKGVRHQLNGYLRPRVVDPIVAPNSSASDDVQGAASMAMTTTTSTLSSSTAVPPRSKGADDMSYLSHPPAKFASSAPAPLFQFLDPYELGMSPKDIEDSLNQLKDNFALAAAASAGVKTTTDGNSSNEDFDCHVLDHGTSASIVTRSDVSSRSSSSASSVIGSDRGGGDDSLFSSALPRRMARGMLRPNDSLIDLAMLPVLDSEGAGTSNKDYTASAFSRDDSIINFIAAGYGNGVECDIVATTTTTGRTSGDDGGLGWGMGWE